MKLFLLDICCLESSVCNMVVLRYIPGALVIVVLENVPVSRQCQYKALQLVICNLHRLAFTEGRTLADFLHLKSLSLFFID